MPTDITPKFMQCILAGKSGTAFSSCQGSAFAFGMTFQRRRVILYLGDLYVSPATNQAGITWMRWWVPVSTVFQYMEVTPSCQWQNLKF